MIDSKEMWNLDIFIDHFFQMHTIFFKIIVSFFVLLFQKPSTYKEEEEEDEKPSPFCPLRDSSSQRIPKLAIKVYFLFNIFIFILHY